MQEANEDRYWAAFAVKCVVGGLLLLMVTVGGCYYWAPNYHVWQQGMEGRAAAEKQGWLVRQQALAGEGELKKQEYERRVITLKAMAERDAAYMYAQAESIRATGASAATRIISDGLRGNEAYLQYLAIQSQKQMADSPNHTTVYIPTGTSGIPLVRTVNGGE